MHELSLLRFNQQTNRFENDEIAVDADVIERLRLDRYRSLLARGDYSDVFRRIPSEYV